ncbi:MAG: hypothetical protein V9G09_12135 [Candidatus Nanopelagicales bacterium]
MTAVAGIGLDTSVPALLVRTGEPKWDYGALATCRTLGRCGVRTFVLAHRSERELMASRYVTARVGPPLGAEAEASESVTALNKVARAIGSPCVVIAGDDESAVLLAEQADVLDPRLLSFPIAGDLPRRLSDKIALGSLAADAGVAYPRFLVSDEPAAVAHFAAEVGFPVVVKSPAPFSRLRDEAVMHTALVGDPAELSTYERAAQQGHRIFVQQYLAGSGTQLWYAAGVALPQSRRVEVWTGRKLLDYPPMTGVGVLNLAHRMPVISARMRQLCVTIGYTGPFDSDWVYDPVAGVATLIDFNPRRGAQFRLFQTTTGLDVVRACHLGLTGGPLHWGQQIEGIRHTVENLALLRATAAMRELPGEAWSQLQTSWWSPDDPCPASVIGVQMAGSLARRVGRRFTK